MKLLRQTARRRGQRGARTRRAPAVVIAAVAVAVALWLSLAALLPAGNAAVPAARAWEYRDTTQRVASINVPDGTVYPGTNTYYAIQHLDANGQPAPGADDAGTYWAAADDAARAIVADLDGAGSVFGNRLWIPVRADAAPGDYAFNIRTRSRNYDREPEAATTMTITVIGPPARLDARLTRSEYEPGDRVIGYASVRDANGALATYTRDPRRGDGVPERCRDCFWEAADAASAAALEIPEGYLSSGTVRARVANDAAGGEYRIIVSHPTVGGETLSFTVVGEDDAVTPAPEPTPAPGTGTGGGGGVGERRPVLPPGPANYTLAGHREIAAGRTGIFTVTGTDAAGGLPNLEGANARVYVLLDGAGADAVTLSGAAAADGTITLADNGVGSFGLQVAAGTAPTTVGLEIVGAIGSEPVIRELNIGTEQPVLPDLGDAASLTLQPGAAAAAGSVTLSWTPGANSDRHWIAGIKVSDWEAGNFDNIIWTRANANDTHTVTGLDAGAEYAFTVIAGRLVNGVTEWGNWSPIQRVTVPVAAQ